jgi:O-acetyl-ADP-ribose deacetylase (regulator of RNase III)
MGVKMNQLIKKINLTEDCSLEIIMGDITDENVDAIVNAANSNLKHGGGVAGAISKKGGPIIQIESNKIGFVPVGNVALTSAGNLPAKCIIHAVGPRWGEGEEEVKLNNAVINSLQLAEKNKFESISLPAISSGIFGFPKERCAELIITAIKNYMSTNKKNILKVIRICLFDQETVKLFLKYL